MKAKHQRLTLVLLALGAVGGASVLALSALEDEAAFFYAPSDAARGVPVGKAVRLGGMVETGSLKRAADGVTQHFVVRDDGGRVAVSFAGIAPDLFKEGSGVVAEGSFVSNERFVATNLLAKHDERYMPPQTGKTLHKTASLEK
jgi:cytochrome c-type biogenesis protein CcmE